MANEGAGAGADASGAGGAGGADASGANTQGGATGAQGGADASGNVEHWRGEAKNAFAARDAAKAAQTAAQSELEKARARIAELEKATTTQGGTSGGSNTGTGATTQPPKVTEVDWAAKAKEAAQAVIDADRADRNRQKLEETVVGAFKAAGGQHEALVAPMVEKAIKENKLTIDANGRVVTGHEVFVSDLKKAYPFLFAPDVTGSLPGGSGAAIPQDVRKVLESGRRGSLATGPALSNEQRKNAEQALRKK